MKQEKVFIFLVSGHFGFIFVLRSSNKNMENGRDKEFYYINYIAVCTCTPLSNRHFSISLENMKLKEKSKSIKLCVRLEYTRVLEGVLLLFIEMSAFFPKVSIILS